VSTQATDAGLDSVVEREKAFYNEKNQTSYEKLRLLIWRSLGEFPRGDEISQYYDPAGKDVLDYGCGTGDLTKELCDRGALHVTGFDISEGEVDTARQRAIDDGVGDKTTFFVADAHKLDLPDDSFDLIVGSSILHHLDLRVALLEIRRILRPGGRAVFLEPLWHNPVLRAGRALTPGARTDDEHPLTVKDWALCKEIFPEFEHHEREFLTLPLLPLNFFLTKRAQGRLARRVHAWDDQVLERYPRMRKYSRLTFLVLK